MHWRTQPELTHRLHPQHPDDLQVLVHDGGPRITRQKPELVWVTITSFEDGIYGGRVLNAPNQLQSVAQHQIIRFKVESGTDYAVMVTEKYLREKPNWNITPCDKCGFTELFDAPSDLIRAAFPSMPADAQLEAFTAFCPLCGGVQLLAAKTILPTISSRPWWQFWARR